MDSVSSALAGRGIVGFWPGSGPWSRAGGLIPGPTPSISLTLPPLMGLRLMGLMGFIVVPIVPYIPIVSVILERDIWDLWLFILWKLPG